MKVLRTALFSAFLMVCFMNVGHTQRSGTPMQNIQNADFYIDNLSAVYNIPEGSQYVRVEYDIVSTAFTSNYLIHIVDESDGSTLFTQNVFGQSVSVLVEPNAMIGMGYVISCYAHNQDTGDMARMACVAAINSGEDEDEDEEVEDGGN